jgi:hypothetical protein
MNATIHDVRLTNRVTITLVFNIEEESWIIINDGTNGSIGGKMGESGAVLKERTHHHFWVGSRYYELVIDPSEDEETWETFSFFDVKKQKYIEGANGNIVDGAEGVMI